MSTNDTEPITPIDTLIVTRALHDAAQTIGSIVGAKTSHFGRWRVERLAGQYRAAADFLDVMHKAASPDILRRAADQIDPVIVPAEPDLTTADGWSALASEEADAGGQLPAIGSAEECAAAATARRCFDHSGAGWSLLTEALADWASTRLPR
jgi:hypothetical protein